MHKSWVYGVLLLTCLANAGCMQRKGPPAPVIMRSAAPKSDLQDELSTITVKRGDSVGSLARKYKVRPQDIIAFNSLKYPYYLQTGQKIFLRKKGGNGVVSSGASHASITPARPMFHTTPPKPGQIKAVSLEEVKPSETGSSLPEKKNVFSQSLPDNTSTKPGENPKAKTVERVSVVKAVKPQADPEKIAEQKFLSAEGNERKSKARDKEPEAIKKTVKVPKVNEDTDRKPLQQQQEEAAANVKKKSSEHFSWPLKGKILKGYGKQDNGFQNDGINIEAEEGSSIQSAADGIVAYVGNELQGFGNLVMVKHQNGWMSAYAHCSATLVKRGDKVKRGQTLAKVGHTGSVRTPQLHFELRKKTKAVDPSVYLE